MNKQSLFLRNKLLVICGPTATGKTRLALYLAKVFNGEIISADSRQVYQGMDIGTGKEWGQGVKIWGYDLVAPTQEFSVAHYAKIAREIIKDIWQRQKLPILVGGTGLYLEAVTAGFETLDVGRNQELRATLKNKSAHELFTILGHLDARKARSLNFSDKQNPRRLIRAIEVAQTRKVSKEKKPFKADILWIGLKAPRALLQKRIAERVEKRLEQGFEKEVEKLLEEGVSWQSQAMTSLGYRQWRDFLEGRETKKEAMLKWQKEEEKYAKRQMTWFRRNKKIKWFDISLGEKLKENVEKTVEKWYPSKDAEKN